MLNTVKINEDKTLEKTLFRPIYQNENRADEIQFLIDPNVFENDIKNYKIILQAIIPIEDKENNSPTTNKMRYMEIEESLYKNKYKMTLPITAALTEGVGDVIFWFLFFDMTDENKVKLLKTDTLIINIKKVHASSSIELEDKEFENVITDLQKDIEDIKENKMDKKFDYDAQNNTILFYSNGKPIGDIIKLDDEITWYNWD